MASQGFGEYISAKADQDVARYQQEREAWEVENNNEGEISEMCDIYKDRQIGDFYRDLHNNSSYILPFSFFKMGRKWFLLGRGCSPTTPRHFWVIYEKNIFVIHISKHDETS